MYTDDFEASAMASHLTACAQAIISDNGAGDSIEDVYLNTYKCTTCGPWISVRLHDGEVRHCDELEGIKAADISAIWVGSIVEDSEAEVCADWIELADCESPEDAVKRFNATVEWVNDEACALWEEANNVDDNV